MYHWFVLHYKWIDREGGREGRGEREREDRERKKAINRERGR